MCSVRCPKDMCEEEGCPKCETVCSPAKCHPVCEETKCDWKCKKPTTCPKPKCELQCEKPQCETIPKCCECTQASNAAAAAASASALIETEGSIPSFLELMHNLRHADKSGSSMCCPCAA